MSRGKFSQSQLSLTDARRIALTAQGFDRPRPGGPAGTHHLRRTIQQLGLVQIDYVNVLAPAHYQVPYSRLGPYDRARFDDLVYQGRNGLSVFTEQWAHEASIVPVETWPLLRHRMETHRVRPWGFEKFMKKHPDYVSWVLDQVRVRGPSVPMSCPIWRACRAAFLARGSGRSGARSRRTSAGGYSQ
jgi:uncharacterized protein YcaQ